MALSPVLAELVGQDRVSCFFMSLHLTQSFLSSQTCAPSVILHDMKVNNTLFLYGWIVSGQDEVYAVFWLATWVGKIYLSCPLGTSRVLVPHEKISVYGHMINPLLTKLDWSSWVHIGPVPFCILINLDFYSRSIKTHPAILISRLVNNAIW